MERGVPVRGLRSANSTCTHAPGCATESTTAKSLVSAGRQESNKKVWFGLGSVYASCGRLTIGRVLKEKRRQGSGALGRSDGRGASRQEQSQGREEGHSWDRFTVRVLR